MNRIVMVTMAAGMVLALAATGAPAFAEASAGTPVASEKPASSASATASGDAKASASATAMADPSAGSGQAKSADKPGELGKLTLKDEPLKVLRGRMTVRVPAAAKIEPRSAPDGAAAAPSPAEETRIVLDAGRERLILIVTETFLWADKDFGERVAKLFPDGIVAPMSKDGPDPKSYLIIPKEPKPGATATLAAMALAVLPDKTVVELDAYVNAEARRDLPGCTKLATAILSSAAAGDVPLDRKGGVRQVPLELGKGIEVTVPPDWVMTAGAGPDFSVYYLRPISPFGSSPPEVMLYVGEHPSELHTRQPEGGGKKPAFTESDGLLLGKRQRWFSWTTGSGADVRQHAEAVAEAGDHSLVHVHYSAPTDAEMEELGKVVQLFKLVNLSAK